MIMIENMYIKLGTNNTYIIATDINNSSTGYNVIKDDMQSMYNFNEVEEYYKNHPECRFDEFTDIKELQERNKKLSIYNNEYNKYSTELEQLNQWFTNIYDIQILQYERSIRLNTPYDEKYGTIEELDTLAVKNSQRIIELRDIIAELEQNKPI